jgi:hypothetical protein
VDAVKAAVGAAFKRPVALSTFGQSQTLVCDCEFSDEELCIVTAFGGTDFDRDGVHGAFP